MSAHRKPNASLDPAYSYLNAAYRLFNAIWVLIDMECRIPPLRGQSVFP
jgi:hypothetical protein